MKQNIKRVAGGLVTIATLALLVGAPLVLAQDPPPTTEESTFGAEVTTVDTTREVKTTLENIVGWVQVFFYIVATLMIILAAWSYLTAGGDETKLNGAKSKVIYALIAIAIAIIAGGVVTLVRNFVG